MADPLRHRQTKGAATDMVDLTPPRYIPTLPYYGYARVSTDGQSVEAQVRQLRAAGAGKVFREVASGAKTVRAPLSG
jgi:hypothetical protein